MTGKVGTNTAAKDTGKTTGATGSSAIKKPLPKKDAADKDTDNTEPNTPKGNKTSRDTGATS